MTDFKCLACSWSTVRNRCVDWLLHYSLDVGALVCWRYAVTVVEGVNVSCVYAAGLICSSDYCSLPDSSEIVYRNPVLPIRLAYSVVHPKDSSRGDGLFHESFGNKSVYSILQTCTVSYCGTCCVVSILLNYRAWDSKVYFRIAVLPGQDWSARSGFYSARGYIDNYL